MDSCNFASRIKCTVNVLLPYLNIYKSETYQCSPAVVKTECLHKTGTKVRQRVAPGLWVQVPGWKIGLLDGGLHKLSLVVSTGLYLDGRLVCCMVASTNSATASSSCPMQSASAYQILERSKLYCITIYLASMSRILILIQPNHWMHQLDLEFRHTRSGKSNMVPIHKSSVVDLDPDRIGIILADPHPFQSDVKPNKLKQYLYFFPFLFNIGVSPRADLRNINS
jgi:hypothetical protein